MTLTLSILFPFCRACFHIVKAGEILVPDPATGTVGGATIVTDTHTSLFRHTCMLILIRKRTHMRILNDDEIRLLRRTSSLNDRSKLKGQYKDVKSGCGLSVGPSLLPHSLSLKTFLVTLSL